MVKTCCVYQCNNQADVAFKERGVHFFFYFHKTNGKGSLGLKLSDVCLGSKSLEAPPKGFVGVDTPDSSLGFDRLISGKSCGFWFNVLLGATHLHNSDVQLALLTTIGALSILLARINNKPTT